MSTITIRILTHLNWIKITRDDNEIATKTRRHKVLTNGKCRIPRQIRVPANQWVEYQIISISAPDALVC